MNWFFWFILMAILAHSFTKKTLQYITFAQFLLLIRNILPLGDFDDKSHDMEVGSLNIFILMQIFTVTVIQIGFNFISKFKFAIIMSPLTATFSCLGAYKMIYKDEEGLYQILIEQKRGLSFALFCINCNIGLIFLYYILQFGEREILNIWLERNNMIEKVESIFHSLQEAIITINVQGISFTNGHGKEVL